MRAVLMLVMALITVGALAMASTVWVKRDLEAE